MDKNKLYEKIIINKYIDFILDRLDLLINLKDKKDNLGIIECYLQEINKFLKIVVEKLNNVL